MKKITSEIASFLIGQSGLRIDYWDIHHTSFVSSANIPVESVVKEILFSMPLLMVWLLTFREFVAGLIGLKTANGKQSLVRESNSFQGNIGDKIALFEVWNRSNHEIVTGQRDRHLDFGLSFYIDQHNECYELKLITVVQLNNFIGKIFFLLVKPIHKLMMPVTMKRLAKRVQQAL